MSIELKISPTSSEGAPRLERLFTAEEDHPILRRSSASHLDKRIRDQWLRNLGSPEQQTIWSQEDIEEAQKNAKGIKKLIDRQDTVAVISGSLALGASLVGMVPTFGPLIGAPFAFFANYYGTYEGAELGFDYARLADARQDLYKDSEKLYTALAIRLLDKYIKSLSAEKALALEKAHNGTVIVMDDARKQKLSQKKAEIQELARRLSENLPALEKQAAETLWGHKLRIRSPEEVKKDSAKLKKPKSLTGKIIKAVTASELDKERTKNQQQVLKIKKEIQNATLSLKEVCHFISGEQSDFSVVILHNERDTMTLRCENELNNKLRAGLDGIRDKETNELRNMVKDLMQANQALMEELHKKKEKKHHHHHHHHSKSKQAVSSAEKAKSKDPG